MSTPEKPIVISTHAGERMRQRGATVEEVEHAIRSETWRPAERGKWKVKERRPCAGPAPNQQTYAYKAVEVIFADDPRALVVVTVKVFYHN